MAEPHATTAGVLLGSGIGLAGTFMGAQVDALIIGLAAAVFMSIWLPTIDGRLKAAAAVALSSLLAGYASPVAAAWLASEQHGFSSGDPLRLLVALVIGAITPVSIPFAVARLQTFIGGSKA